MIAFIKSGESAVLLLVLGLVMIAIRIKVVSGSDGWHIPAATFLQLFAGTVRLWVSVWRAVGVATGVLVDHQPVRVYH